jgi:hypothetical protein
MSQVAYNVALAAPWALTTGAKTVLMVIAPSGSGLLVCEFGISFDGIAASGVPALVDLVSSTQGGAGTSTETPTITQNRGRVTTGAAPTGGSKYSAEPTTLVRHKAWYVTPNNGILVVQFPLGREPEIDASGGTIRGYGIRVNVPAAVNVLAYMEVEKNG